MIKKLLFNLCIFNALNVHGQWQSETIYNSSDGQTFIDFSIISELSNLPNKFSNVGHMKIETVNLHNTYNYFNNLDEDGRPTNNSSGPNNFIFYINNSSNMFWGPYQEAHVVEQNDRNEFVIAGIIKDNVGNGNVSVYITNYNGTSGLFSNTKVYTIQNFQTPLKLTNIKKIGNYWVIIGYIGNLFLPSDSKQIVFIFDNNLSLVKHAIHVLNNSFGPGSSPGPSSEVWHPRDLIYKRDKEKLVIVGNIDKVEFVNPTYIKRYGYYSELDFSLTSPTLILDRLNIHVADPLASNPATLYEGVTCARIRLINNEYYISGVSEQTVVYTGPFLAKIDNNGYIFERKLYFENPVNATIEEAIDFDYNNTLKRFHLLLARYDGNTPYISKVYKQSIIETDINLNFLSKTRFLSSNFLTNYPNRISTSLTPKILTFGGTEDYNSISGHSLRLDYNSLNYCDFDQTTNDTLFVNLESHSILSNSLSALNISFDSTLNLSVVKFEKDYQINCEYTENNSNESNSPYNNSNKSILSDFFDIYDFKGNKLYSKISYSEFNALNLESGFYILIYDNKKVRKINLIK